MRWRGERWGGERGEGRGEGVAGADSRAGMTLAFTGIAIWCNSMISS